LYILLSIKDFDLILQFNKIDRSLYLIKIELLQQFLEEQILIAKNYSINVKNNNNLNKNIEVYNSLNKKERVYNKLDKNI